MKLSEVSVFIDQNSKWSPAFRFVNCECVFLIVRSEPKKIFNPYSNKPNQKCTNFFDTTPNGYRYKYNYFENKKYPRKDFTVFRSFNRTKCIHCHRIGKLKGTLHRKISMKSANWCKRIQIIHKSIRNYWFKENKSRKDEEKKQKNKRIHWPNKWKTGFSVTMRLEIRKGKKKNSERRKNRRLRIMCCILIYEHVWIALTMQLYEPCWNQTFIVRIQF